MFAVFQFHIGTIKRALVNKTSKFIGYFNSTLVRLKVQDGYNDAVAFAFQFHIGTIKSIVP